MLDTDACIYAMRRQPAIVERLRSLRFPDIGVSVVTEAELRYGAARSGSPAKTLAELERFLLPFETVPFTSPDTEVYASIRSHLERAGTPIGPLDTMIAAHARSLDLVLVTNNEREFRRVPGLRVENWVS